MLFSGGLTFDGGDKNLVEGSLLGGGVSRWGGGGWVNFSLVGGTSIPSSSENPEISHAEWNHGYMQISAALPSPNFHSGKSYVKK